MIVLAPWRFSRITRLTASTDCCIRVYLGILLRTTIIKKIIKKGIIIPSIGAKSGQMMIDITIPPNSNIGERTNPLVTIMTKFCICVTSLVILVIKVAGDKRFGWRSFNATSKRWLLNDSPIFKEAKLPKAPQLPPKINPRTANIVINNALWITYPKSPLAKPWSIILDIKVGCCKSQKTSPNMIKGAKKKLNLALPWICCITIRNKFSLPIKKASRTPLT